MRNLIITALLLVPALAQAQGTERRTAHDPLFLSVGMGVGKSAGNGSQKLAQVALGVGNRFSENIAVLLDGRAEYQGTEQNQLDSLFFVGPSLLAMRPSKSDFIRASVGVSSWSRSGLDQVVGATGILEVGILIVQEHERTFALKFSVLRGQYDLESEGSYTSMNIGLEYLSF